MRNESEAQAEVEQNSTDGTTFLEIGGIGGQVTFNSSSWQPYFSSSSRITSGELHEIRFVPSPLATSPQVMTLSLSSLDNEALQSTDNLYSRENTMANIIYLTAKESEARLRTRHNFPTSTANSDEETALFIDLLGWMCIQRGEYLRTNKALPPFYENLEVALDALSIRRGHSLYLSNKNLDFTDITGYGMKNLIALYWKAIVSEEGFCQHVDFHVAAHAMVNAIANGQRGNNRNNEIGEDDKSNFDYPVCGKGHYNKLAECFVGILNDVQLIFDVQTVAIEFLKTALASHLVRIFSYNSEQVKDFLMYWNTGELTLTGTRVLCDEFLQAMTEQFENLIDQFLVSEFKGRKKVAAEIKQSLLKQAEKMGGAKQFISQITLPDLEKYFLARREWAAQVIQTSWRNYREKLTSDIGVKEEATVDQPFMKNPFFFQ